MISLWTPNAIAAASLRKLFRLNLFEISAPDDSQLQDILTVIAPIKDEPDRMSIFGISTHLSETLRPYINSLKTLSPSGDMPAHSPEPIEYDGARQWLSKLPLEQRLIATPDFMKTHHGLLCLGGTSLSDRVGLALHKRIGRPAFVVNVMPFQKSYSLDYGFRSGLPDVSRIFRSDPESFANLIMRPKDDKMSGSPALILDRNDMNHLRAISGETYLHKLKAFVVNLAAKGETDLGVVWQSDRRRKAMEAFITEAAPKLHLTWTHKNSAAMLNSSSAIFALSAFSGLPAAQRFSRLIHTLHDSPLDGLGSTALWSKGNLSSLSSPQLSASQNKMQNQIIKRIKSQYAFDNAFKSRARFKSVIQEVIINGVPKL